MKNAQTKNQNVVDVLFEKMRAVAAEDVHLKKTLRRIRAEAQRGLRRASSGAIEWKYALNKIIELTE